MDITEFMAHKKDCIEKQIILPIYEDDSPNIEEEESGSLTVKPILDADDQEDDMDKSDAPIDNTDFDGLDSDQLLGSEKSDEFSDTKSDGGSDGVKDTGSLAAEGTEDSQDPESMDLDDSMPSEKAGLSDAPSTLPQSLSTLFGVSNVKIEKMDSTKVAVAQFAENNLPNIPQMDMPMVQTMLYSLHQQQIMQLHMLQQLQQQIMAGLPPSLIPATLASLSSVMTPPRAPPITTPTTTTNTPLVKPSITAVPPPPPPGVTNVNPGTQAKSVSIPHNNHPAGPMTPKTPPTTSPFTMFNSQMFSETKGWYPSFKIMFLLW